MTKVRARAYIDGFNLYYGALRGSRHKWVDLQALADRLLPNADVDSVIYCTARVSTTPQDPGVSTRQDTFFRALRAHCDRLEFVEGQFKMRRTAGARVPDKSCGCCTSGAAAPACACCAKPIARIDKLEEKGSDVNLAARLIADGYENSYDLALVISDDSDLQLAVDIVINNLGKKVIVADPRNKKYRALHGSEKRSIRPTTIENCQMPVPVMTRGGQPIHPPSSWR